MRLLAIACVLAVAWANPTRANQYAIPVNTVECSDFQKVDSRTWRATRNVNISLGASPEIAVRAGNIVKGVYVSSDKNDLFDTLQMKCS